MTIHTYVEKKRGCGFKKPGGLYMIGANNGLAPCCKLPFPLSSCPCCGTAVKFTRGFTWINTDLFCFKTAAATWCSGDCILNMPGQSIGLMWVGESHYPTVRDFEREAAAIGVSKRLNVLPKGLQPGAWVVLAHNKAVVNFNDSAPADPAADLVTYKPGAFMVFKVEKLQYVVKPSDTEETLKRIADKNIELIEVKPEGSALPLFSE